MYLIVGLLNGANNMRQVAFSERFCVFELLVDIKGDVLGQPLAGILHEYYRRQVETW